MALGALSGFTFGITADRRWEEQAMLLERRGARVLHGPTIRTLPLSDEPVLERATRAVIDDPPDVVVLTTGVGARGWFAAAASAGIDDALLRVLRGATVLARGPKAAGAALTSGLAVAWRAPTERSREVLSHLGAVAGRRIVVQRDGADTADLADELRLRGADVVDIPVYRWVVPDDVTGALRVVDAACAGQLDAITFTSAPAVQNLARIADDVGRRQELLDAFAGGVRAICVGPVCAEAASTAGIAEPVAPEPGRLGAMVRAAEDAFAGRSHDVTIGAASVRLQGASVVVDGEHQQLSDRERALLEVLLRAGGAVVSKDQLIADVWDGAVDAHVVEVTIGRLRSRVGPAGSGIVTVPRRGYRLDLGATR